MTIPETPPAARFALFSNGANFSRRVLEHLLQRAARPELLVFPGYPPAPADASSIQFDSPRCFSDLVDAVERIYAPPERQQACADLLRRRGIDYVLVACWPYLIGPALRQCPRAAALNLHPSLLPLYRGADPIEAQLSAGEIRGGVSLHLLDERFDHGPVVAQAEFEIASGERRRKLLERRCASLGVELFIDAIRAGRAAWRCRRQAG